MFNSARQRFNIFNIVTRHFSSVENDISRIPHNSNLLVGGFLTNGVPTHLLNMLLKANVFNLTLITNASILHNKELKSLLRTDGKVKRLFTSLESNRQALHDSELKYYFELIVQSSSSFIKNFCFQDLNDVNSSGCVGDYALVKSMYIDKHNNLIWPNDMPTYYNDLFAQSARYFAIAEGGPFNLEHTNSKYQIKTNGVFVHSVYYYESSKMEEKNETTDLSRINFDTAYETIVKRLLIEFKDGDKIVISDSLKFLVQNLYFPSHINVDIMAPCILQKWPSNFEWLNLIQKLDLCVVHTNAVSENGEINLETSNMDECMIHDIMNNIGEKTRLIAVMKFDDSKIKSTLNVAQLGKCKIDLLITDKCVFKLNKHEKKLELIEYSGELNDLKTAFDAWNVQPLISRNVLQTIKQEYI